MPSPTHAALQPHQGQHPHALIPNSLGAQSPSRRHVMPCSGPSSRPACATKAAIAHAALQQPHAVQQARMPGAVPVEAAVYLYTADQPSPVHQCHLGTAAQEGQERRRVKQEGPNVSRGFVADAPGTVPAMRYCLSSSEPAHGAGIWEEQTTRYFSPCLVLILTCLCPVDLLVAMLTFLLCC